MYNIVIIAKYTIIDLLNVRLFLQIINLFPGSDQEYAAHRILYPFNNHFSQRMFTQSLTLQAIGKEDQLRFLLIQEINKWWGMILNQLLSKYSKLTIQIYQSQNLGDGSKSFFDWIAQSNHIQISYHPFQDPQTNAATFKELELTPEEKWILEVTQYPSTLGPSDQKLLFDHAHLYLCLGDAWTCLNINYLLLPHKPEFLDQMYVDLGFAHNALLQTYQTEFFIAKWLEVTTGQDKVMALYMYAVILSRFYPAYFKDYPKALSYLDEANQYIQSLEPTLSQKELLSIKSVYNFALNGKAYVLFQQKKYDEVIDLLKEGMEFLDQNPELSLSLSHSLFVYNLAQAYRQIGDKEKIIQTYEKLLELDPSEVVYILDFANYYIELKELDKALELANRSLKINDSLAMTYAVLGYIFLQQGELQQSESQYQKAFELLPTKIEYLYNYAYVLALQEKYQIMLDLLDKNQWQLSDKKAWLSFSNSYYINFLFLYAEGLTYCNQVEKAVQMLSEAHSRFPDHLQIQENLRLLENIPKPI